MSQLKKFIVAASALCILTLSSGCHRSFYRLQADEEALAIISEKASDPRWSIPDFALEPDPRSRMYSPFSQDHPPMPSDDPASAQLMEWVDGKPGYPHWHANGDSPFVDNPEWMLFVPFDENGSVTLSMEEAFRLALLHNRNYQTQNENLYLAALDVSLERFDFETQIFAGYQSFFTVDGWRRGASSLLDGSTRNTFARKAGVTGSTLLVGFANTMLWQFSGPNTQTVNTLVDFSLIQPLLRGAGRDRILESLTQSERTLLATIRDLERFRREFFLGITTGNGGAGLSSSGFLELLQTKQQIRIREANVATQRSVVSQFKALVEAGRINNQQLQFTQSSLYNAQEALLLQKNNYEFSLDQFKLDLGLPPDLQISVEDDILDQFELVDAEMTDRQNRLTDLQDVTGTSILYLLDLRRDRAEELGFPIGAVDFNASGFRVVVPPTASVDWTPELVEGLEQILVNLDQTAKIHREIMEISLPEAKSDIDHLDSQVALRVESLKRLRAKLQTFSKGEGDYAIEPEVLSDELLEEAPGNLRNFVALLERRLVQFEETLEKARLDVQFLIDHGEELSDVARATYLQADVTNKVPTYLRDLSALYLELILIQVEARTDSIVLPPVDIAAERAVEVARLYRRDWMNARAELVDAWRNIEFVADELESEFDLIIEGDVSNVSKNPLDLQSSTGRMRAGFEFDTPITRLAERNNYRAALINYQRARRDYYEFEDTVSLSLRQTIRTMEQIKYNFEISRRGVRLAVERVDQTDSELSRPPSPNASSRSLGNTAARDLLDALDDLRDTQLSFLNQWVRYEVLRRQLDLDMGTMELDEYGVWIDPGEITPERADELIQEALSWPQAQSTEDFGGYPQMTPAESIEGEIDGVEIPESLPLQPATPIDAEPSAAPYEELRLNRPGRGVPNASQRLDEIDVPLPGPIGLFPGPSNRRSPGRGDETPGSLPWDAQPAAYDADASESRSNPAAKPSDQNVPQTTFEPGRLPSRELLEERGQSLPIRKRPADDPYFQRPGLEPWQAIPAKGRDGSPSSDLSSRRSSKLRD